MKPLRRAPVAHRPWYFAMLTFVALWLLAATAGAQSFTAHVPGSPASPTAPIPNTVCGAMTTRTYAAWTFNAAATGNYSFTFNRTSGTGLTFTLYQGVFLPSNTCVNQWSSTVASGSGSLTSVQNLSVPGMFIAVIGGANASDVFNVNVTTTGPGTLTSVCTDSSLTPSSQAVTNAGGSFSTMFAPATGCSNWTATGVPAWITGIPASGSGPATINYNVAANGGASRNANINIGGATLSVSEAASCNTTLNPTMAAIAAAGGGGNFMLNGTAGCAFSTVANVPWIHAVLPGSGTGSSVVTFTVDPNTGPARSGTITAGGQTFTVNQASGCTYMVDRTLVLTPAAGGAQSVMLTTAAGCPWTTASMAPWLTGFTASGAGSATIGFTVAANPSPMRNGTFTVGGQTVNVVQSDGCNVTVTPPANMLSAAGGMGSVMIGAGAGCTWTASATVPWITPGATMGTGPATLTYTVAANAGAMRSGAVLVSGHTHTVDQAGTAGPMITQQPMGLTVDLGQPFMLSVMASGSGVTYQWRRAMMPQGGRTMPTYAVAAAALADDADYDVIVTNGGGSVMSNTVHVTVRVPAEPGPEPTVDAGTDAGADAADDVSDVLVVADAADDTSADSASDDAAMDVAVSDSAVLDAASDAARSEAGASDGAREGSASDGATSAGDGSVDGGTTGRSGSCGCRAPGSAPSGGGLGAGLLGLAALLARRRTRR